MGYLNSSGEEIPHAHGAAKPMVKAVRFYQKYLSPLKMVSTCRFEPTCSAYALEALSVHGAFKTPAWPSLGSANAALGIREDLILYPARTTTEENPCLISSTGQSRPSSGSGTGC